MKWTTKGDTYKTMINNKQKLNDMTIKVFLTVLYGLCRFNNYFIRKTLPAHRVKGMNLILKTDTRRIIKKTNIKQLTRG